jgi:hypothetical protein
MDEISEVLAASPHSPLALATHPHASQQRTTAGNSTKFLCRVCATETRLRVGRWRDWLMRKHPRRRPSRTVSSSCGVGSGTVEMVHPPVQLDHFSVFAPASLTPLAPCPQGASYRHVVPNGAAARAVTGKQPRTFAFLPRGYSCVG